LESPFLPSEAWLIRKEEANREGLHKWFTAEAIEFEGSFGGVEWRKDQMSFRESRLCDRCIVSRCQQCWPAGRRELESRGRKVSRRSSDTGDGARILSKIFCSRRFTKHNCTTKHCNHSLHPLLLFCRGFFVSPFPNFAH
jgi:hypothetical protein